MKPFYKEHLSFLGCRLISIFHIYSLSSSCQKDVRRAVIVKSSGSRIEVVGQLSLGSCKAVFNQNYVAWLTHRLLSLVHTLALFLQDIYQ